MGFTLDDLTPKRPATAVTPVTNFPDDNAVKPKFAVPVQTTNTEPGKGTAIDTTGITGNGGKESFAQQPTEEVTKVEPNQGIKIDWSRPYAEIEQNPILQQMKPYDIMRDYQKNGDGNWSVFMPWLNTLGDGDKTVAANEALKKKAERQAKMEQWSNFLMHLGNFFGTVQGAPSQKIESAQELTDRQRKIREATEALRAKGYNQMMVNIYKDRQDKQSQMQAEAAAKANEALAAYRGSQKNQTDALTPVKVQTEKERGNAAAAQAALSTSKKNTEDALRGKKGKLLDAQTNNANAGAADHNASVNVKGAQVRHINSQTEGQNQRNANQKEADDFNTRYVNDPVFKKHVNQWAENNGMSIGGNDGRGGTWANEKNRQQASRWAKAQMKFDRTPPSRRGGGGSKVPPSRRGGGSKVPPSRRRK
ncbi:hypothetical protein [Segatella copri]|uniref:hypothetical protein n=1 Tax=Segatella copri TaxID=165179 RepID=UPI00294B0588|nr:hypothetical protein [Segatella copri]